RRREKRLRYKNKNKTASFKLASLNIRGQGSQNISDPANKWNHVNQLLRTKEIAILCIQETHLTEERAAEIESSFSRRFVRIISSADPVNPTAKGGVAIVLNRQFVKEDDDIHIEEIVPGRALLIRTKWNSNRSITILNIYAPNVTPSNGEESKVFWETLLTHFQDHPNAPKPDFVLGDFNMVEDVIDRLPSRSDPEDSVNALDDLKLHLGIQDGWRAINPGANAYTYSSAWDSHSRIDRIYATRRMLKTARDWEIQPADGIPSADHRMVSVHAVHEDDPLIGKGRWSLPHHLIKDKVFAKTLNELGRKALEKIKSIPTRTNEENAQTIFAAFKTDLRAQGRKRAKFLKPLTELKLRKTTAALQDIQSNLALDESERRKEISRLKREESDLEALLQKKIRTTTATRHWLEGETVSKYWTQVN
ncbi:DNase I-like protein, partial [Schizopora paradoxa]